jgi:hypothetical protein
MKLAENFPRASLFREAMVAETVSEKLEGVV